MSNFSFLNQYVVPSTDEAIRTLYGGYKHLLFEADQNSINNAEKSFGLPLELKEFYTQVGYGFFHQKEEFSSDTLLNPDSFKIINLREEYYEFDPDLELYQAEVYQNKAIFFEVNEGVYLLISKESSKWKKFHLLL